MCFQRVRLVLAARGVDYEIIDINLKVKPDWFLDINPYGQVPVVEHKGKIIRESLIGFGEFTGWCVIFRGQGL